MKRKIAVALATLPSALLLTAAPAFAASSGGTVHYNNPQTCFDYGGAPFCYSSSGQSNTTITPSGNANFVDKGTYSFSYTDGSNSFSSSVDFQEHAVYKQGAAQVLSSKISGSFVTSGQTCTFTSDYHNANGTTQFDRAEVSCT